MLESAPLTRVTDSPAERLSRYRQEHTALQEFVNRLLTPGFDPDFDAALLARAATILGADPDLAEAVAVAITPGRRGPTRSATHSPAAALVKRTYEMAQRTNVTHKGTYVSPGYPDTGTPPSRSPRRGERGDSLRGPKRIAATRSASRIASDLPVVASGRDPNPIFNAFCAIFCDGDWRNASPDEQTEIGQATAWLKNIQKTKGATDEQMVADLAAAHRAYPNVFPNSRETPRAIAKHWAKLVHGPQKDGRSNGTTTEVRQTVYHNGSIRHEESFSQMEERKGIR